MNFKEEISDFKSYMKKCLDYMKDEGEKNLFKYFNEIYSSNFKTTPIDTKINDEIQNLYEDLYNNLLKDDNPDFEKTKNTGYGICQRYLAMKNNLKDYEQYKQSKALECFDGIKNQFEKVKSNFDDNYKNIYNNYIKSLFYIFELINLNLSGNNLSRNIKIEEFKKEIEDTYEKYNNKINDEKQTLEINSIIKIDEYIENIDKFSNPQDEAIDVVKEISESFKKFIQSVIKIIEEYKTELKKIKKKLQNLIILNNSDDVNFINFISIIFPNFLSIRHLGTHGLILVAEGVAYGLLIGWSGPIGWIFAIGIHGVVAWLNYRKDNNKKSLKKNMEDYKTNLEKKFTEYESKIVEILINLKNDTEKEIENFVDSQNSVFKGIKENEEKYKKIVNDFKKIFYEEVKKNNL